MIWHLMVLISSKPPRAKRMAPTTIRSIFAKVAPEMMRLKVLDGSRKSDLDYYLQAGQMMSEQFKREQDIIAKEANRKSQQKEIEEAANKRKSASLPRSTSGKKKVIDYLDEEDDENYKKWYKKTMSQS